MTRAANLHELTRDALAQARARFPAPIIDVEHRGEGDCEIDDEAFVAALASLLACALAALDEGESLWMRSSGVDSSRLTVDLRWKGAEPDAASLAGAMRDAAAAAGTVERDAPDGRDRHLRLALRRFS